MRSSALFLLFTALACGGGPDPGPVVDAENGPPSGPRLGDPAPAATAAPSNFSDSMGEVHSLGTSAELGIEMNTSVSVANGVVTAARWSASTPGPDGNDLCWWVQEQLDARYGASSGMGLPGVYPQREWRGEQVLVKWSREGELGTDRYTCVVRWVPAPAMP